MSGWCGDVQVRDVVSRRDRRNQGRNVDDDDDDDDRTPKSLSRLLFPQLSTPSLCVMSGILLAIVNGMKFLESYVDAARDRGRYDGDEDCDEGTCDPSGHSDHRTAPPDDVRWDRYFDMTATTMAFLEALLLPVYQSTLFYPLLVLLTLLALLLLQYNRLREVLRTTSPVPGLPSVPNANPLFGHYGLLMDPRMHPYVFRDHATPSGISSLWGPGLKRCASVLRASHARLVLRQTSQRDFR